ncbi:MAG: hypothetical protein RRX92_01035 [Lachnospiraceae bacterium]
MKMTKMKERMTALFEGEITITKKEVWLIAGFALFLGITIGFVKAPFTHGVTIGSNNGNGWSKDEECDCIGVCDGAEE